MELLGSPTSLHPAALAAALPLLYMYLNAKLHLHKDLQPLVGRHLARRALAAAVRADRLSPYYLVEARATDPARADTEAIWAREWRRDSSSSGSSSSGTVAASSTSSYTWRALLARAHQFAGWFRARGVGRGDLVAFYMANSAEFLIAWIGLWAIGAAPALVNYHLKGAALVHCLRVSGARLVLVDGDEAAEGRVVYGRGDMETAVEEGGEGRVRFVRLRDVMQEVEGMSTERPPDELRKGVKATDPMALFYTSGTTGMPKACPFPVAAAIGPRRRTATVERIYVCMPLYHGTGGLGAMGQLAAGYTICVTPKFSVSTFWLDVRESRATWFLYVGETLRYLLAAPPSPLDRQHNVHSIFGNGLRPDVWQRFCDRFGIVQVYEFFNSTEAMLSLHNPSMNEYTAHAVGHHGFLQRWVFHDYYVPVGVDPETGDIARDPKTGFARRMPYEVGGEILVRVSPDRQFAGYWRDPEATDKKLVRDVFRKGDCFYRTGDALRRDSEGRWFFLDRLGDTFRWKGENVSTAAVSEVLGKYPGVLEANVYGVELPGHDGKAGAAAIHIDPVRKETFDHQGFLRHARTHLPKYAVPLFLRHVQAPFRMHNNKQNKMPLKQEGVDPEKVANVDKLFWIDRHGKGATYIPFTRQDWDDLHVGKAKL